jgi:hypothetical protein
MIDADRVRVILASTMDADADRVRAILTDMRKAALGHRVRDVLFAISLLLSEMLAPDTEQQVKETMTTLTKSVRLLHETLQRSGAGDLNEHLGGGGKLS